MAPADLFAFVLHKVSGTTIANTANSHWLPPIVLAENQDPKLLNELALPSPSDISKQIAFGVAYPFVFDFSVAFALAFASRQTLVAHTGSGRFEQ